MSILNKFKSQLEGLNVALPFMEGREKLECKTLALQNNGTIVTIDNIGFMELPDDNGILQEVGVITIREDREHFIFTGQAVTDTLKKIESILGDEMEEALMEGLPVEFIIRKSKNKREYVSLKVIV